MKKVTDYQRNFLLNYFFKNEAFAGWKNIANKLLDNGYCIVAGHECIWKGGIGNFIKTEEAEEFIGCVKYVFDLEYFLTSEWYKQISKSYISELYTKKRQLELEHDEICDL